MLALNWSLTVPTWISLLCTAAKAGRIEMIETLLHHGARLEYLSILLSVKFSGNSTSDILMQLESLSSKTLIALMFCAAAQSGKINVLEWLYAHRKITDAKAMEAAARGGYVGAMQWLWDRGISFQDPRSVTIEVMGQDQLLAFQWLTKKFPHQLNDFAFCLEQLTVCGVDRESLASHPKILRAMRERFPSITKETLSTFSDQNLVWKLLRAVEGGDPEIVAYVLEMLSKKNVAVPWIEVLAALAKKPNLRDSEWENVYFSFSSNFDTDLLLWANTLGLAPLDGDALTRRASSVAEMKELFAEGATWHDGIWCSAVRRGDLEMCRWAIANSFPTSNAFSRTTLPSDGVAQLEMYRWSRTLPNPDKIFRLDFEDPSCVAEISGELWHHLIRHEQNERAMKLIFSQVSNVSRIELAYQAMLDLGHSLPKYFSNQLREIVSHCQLGTIRWLSEHASKHFDQFVFQEIAARGQLEVLMILHSRGVAIPAVTIDKFGVPKGKAPAGTLSSETLVALIWACRKNLKFNKQLALSRLFREEQSCSSPLFHAAIDALQ